METLRSPKQSTYDIGSCAAMLAVLIVILALFTAGCTNMTVVRLAEMCHAAEKSPTVSFGSETGKVDCK